ncbi:Dihydroorotate dehydrogenase B (NAD(+)), catalytic subunit [Desulfovibrionales bacterium]
MDFSVDLPGLMLKNPVLTASGTVGYGLELAPYGDLRRLGGIVVKGLSLSPRVGNTMPRIVETPCGMLNAIGIQNIGAPAFLRERLPLLPWREVPIIANLYACDLREFGELAYLLAAAEGVAALEVNISCPNVQAGGIFFGHDPAAAAAVTREVKGQAGTKPVIVKLSPNVTDIGVIAAAVEDAGADLISCINTLAGMAVDAATRRPRLANVVGGLSGSAIKPVALRCVFQVASRVKIPVIGLGGITSAEDVLEFLLVGAHAVQIGTGVFWRPDLPFHIVDELPGLCERLGIDNLMAYRGSLRLSG